MPDGFTSKMSLLVGVLAIVTLSFGLYSRSDHTVRPPSGSLSNF
jgi:hypothetical protein